MRLALALPYAKGARCDTCGHLTTVHQYEARFDCSSTVTLMCDGCVRAALAERLRPQARHDQEEAAELDWVFGQDPGPRVQRIGPGEYYVRPDEGDCKDGGVCQ